MRHDVDVPILDALRADARTPFLSIAKQLKVSEGTVRNRVGKMLKDGVIRKFTLETGAQGGVEALVGLKLETKVPTDRVVKRLLATPGVSAAFEVAGKYDVVILLREPDMPGLNTALEKVRQTQDVIETESFTILKKH